MMTQPSGAPSGREGRGAGDRRGARQARQRQQAHARELRWQNNRYAVPYRTDGPKVTFGVMWFAAMMAAAVNSPVAVGLLASVVALLAGLQAGHAWFPNQGTTHWWTAAAAFVAGIGGVFGVSGLVAGIGFASAILIGFAVLNAARLPSVGRVLGALFRSALPPGIAAASLAALGEVETGAIVSLVLLVSAYEAGDFLVGSGSSNAVEGPVSGLVALAAVIFILWVVAPTPFTSRSALLFGLLAAVCCPLGQLLASALLPRGSAWAPALRRLDSYLLAAPIWLLLLHTTTTASDF